MTSVDISDDGNLIGVTTLAFRQDPNFRVYTADGKQVFGRQVAPWAPFQAAVLDGGNAFAVGLAYSRVTSPLPTISIFGGEKTDEVVLEDSLGEWGWLRYGAGDWRTGWTASLLGDPLARTGSAAVTIRGHHGALKVLATGATEKYPSKYDRPFRMAVSADGSTLACGYILPEPGAVPADIKSALRIPPAIATVTRFDTAESLWKIDSNDPIPANPELPRPALDFPELAASFRMDPDAIVPFRVAASVSISPNGKRVALAEYGGKLWVRKGPAIGGWNPPYHVIPFVPRQRGRVKLAYEKSSHTVDLPREGLFDVQLDAAGKSVWAIPARWFARGMAGAAWLPADPDAKTVFKYDSPSNDWKSWELPDAVSDAAMDPVGERPIVACWNGRLYRLGDFGRTSVLAELGAPARLRWTRDGKTLIAGTESGELVALDRDGTVRWRVTLPTSLPPEEKPQKPVFEGVPVYSAGRVGKEHAYVGDTWFVKTAEGGFLVDAGGSSSIPHSLAKIRAAGGDPDKLRVLLHTHSHGDHAGAAYLWRARGLKIVAPESAALALSWLMPMLTDYGVWVPRPVDVPLPLKKPGDEVEFTIAGQPIRAVFVPGHSMDSVIYLMTLDGKRVAFTGDLGFQAPSDILHRCWGSAAHAAVVIDVVKTKVLPFKPDVVFTGHGGRPEGAAFLEDLVRRSQESLEKK